MDVHWKGGSPSSGGCRMHARLAERRRDWVCPKCKASLRYYWRRCPSCGTRRPEEG